MKLLIVIYCMLPMFSHAQNVGIGNNNPSEKLDVNGNINLTGMLKASGNAGQPGQHLITNGAGSLSWTYGSDFPNFTSFNTSGVATWTVPAGVTKILIEAWGGGGAGNIFQIFSPPTLPSYGNGGGGGGYIRALADVTGISSLNVNVGSGGVITGSNGTASTVQAGAAIALAGGGLNAQGNGVLCGGTGGNFSVSSPGTIITGYDGMDGEAGECGYNYQVQAGTSTLYLHHWGDGGDAGYSSGTGGKSVTTSTTGANNPTVIKPASKPGGGGPGAVNFATPVLNNGAVGKVVIRW